MTPEVLRISEMSTRMQEVMSCRPHRQALYRSDPGVEDRLHIRATMHWVWYLCQEVPLRRDQHHQSAYQPGVTSDPSILGQ